ncbi:MAG: HNH endonuclease [Actinomycetota bacterium]|nr:HNH endonuclease [Actinomycetota bacterium]
MARDRVYDVDEEAFRAAVAANLSLRGTIRSLGLHDHTNTYKRIRQRIDELQLDTSHFGRSRVMCGYSDEQLRSAVAASRSIRQTLLALGLRGEGGNYRIVRREIARLGVSTAHFTSRGWRRGNTTPVTPARDLSQVLVRGSCASTTSVRKRLLREGLKEYRCELCGLTEWRGAPIPLELDHVNGVNDDHRLENLRLLCPNCHSQTDTYRGRNRRRCEASRVTQLSIL